MSSTVTVTPTVTEQVQRARISSRSSADADLVLGRQTEVVVFDGCPTGLGIKIIGGAGEAGSRDFGLFIKRIFFGGLVATDGQLQEGDEILKVNGQSLSGITNKEAVQVLRLAAASDFVKFVVSRDKKARLEFENCLENEPEASYSSSTADQASVCSQSSSRSPQDDRLSPYDAGSPPVSHASSSGSTQGSRQGSRRGTPVNDAASSMSSATYQLTSQTPYRLSGELTNAECDVDTTDAEVVSSCSDVGWDRACASPSPTPRPTPLPAYGEPQPKVSNPTAAALGLARGPLLGPGALTAAQALSGLLAACKTSTPAAGNFSQPSLGGVSIEFAPSPVAFDGRSRDPSGAASFLPASPGGASPREDLVTHDTDDIMLMPTVSLDPRAKIRVEKLEVALRYLGIEPTAKQQQDLRHMVQVDATGYVLYGDFVRAARQMFKHQLIDRSHTLGTSRLNLSRHHEPLASTAHTNTDLGVLLDEREQLRRDLDRCQIALREKEKACSLAEEELLRVRNEAQGAVQEARALRSQVHLAEQARRAAQIMEQDYVEVLKRLEVDLLELKAREAMVMDHPTVQKRLAILTCQLRKSELSKKTYEVATEKLLQFTEAVHEVLTGQGDGVGLRSDAGPGEAARGARPPHYLGRHKRHTPLSLAAEAREVVKTVKSLLDVEPLPFGWDEAYTEDGVKYYINHVTQMTSWSHPLSNVEHTASRPTSSQGRPLPPMPPLKDYGIADSRA